MGFSITRGQRYLNQQVLFVIEVPIGKKIELDKSIEDYKWIDIDLNNHRYGWAADWDNNWRNSYEWHSDNEYIMTANGLKATHPTDEDNDDENAQDDDKKQQLDEIKQKRQQLEEEQQRIEKSLRENDSLQK